jgi:hypothetical protein
MTIMSLSILRMTLGPKTFLKMGGKMSFFNKCEKAECHFISREMTIMSLSILRMTLGLKTFLKMGGKVSFFNKYEETECHFITRVRW